MINIPMYGGKVFPIPEIGINFAVERYEDYLVKLEAVEGFTKHVLRDSYGGEVIYGFSIGDLINKPVIYVDGCIHKGHEWRTSYWIMHFMEALNDPENHYPEMASAINKLKIKYSFYFVPVVAPDCFVASSDGYRLSGNANGVDIAKNFDYEFINTTGGDRGVAPFSEPESQNVRDIILEYKPVLYINCHTHGGYEGFIVRKPFNSEYDILYSDMFNSSVLSTKDTPDTKIYDVYAMSSAYNWTSNQVNSRNQSTIANVFEVGNMQDSLWQSRMGVTGLLLHIIHTDNFLTNNSLTLY